MLNDAYQSVCGFVLYLLSPVFGTLQSQYMQNMARPKWYLQVVFDQYIFDTLDRAPCTEIKHYLFIMQWFVLSWLQSVYLGPVKGLRVVSIQLHNHAKLESSLTTFKRTWWWPHNKTTWSRLGCLITLTLTPWDYGLFAYYPNPRDKEPHIAISHFLLFKTTP